MGSSLIARGGVAQFSEQVSILNTLDTLKKSRRRFGQRLEVGSEDVLEMRRELKPSDADVNKDPEGIEESPFAG